MDSSKAFDAYEVIGVITPGAVVTLLLALQWPEFRALLGQEGLSIGGLGFFVIVAFVLGHLTQAWETSSMLPSGSSPACRRRGCGHRSRR